MIQVIYNLVPRPLHLQCLITYNIKYRELGDEAIDDVHVLNLHSKVGTIVLQVCLPSGSLQEPHRAESVSVTKVMEEMARKSKEIEQLQMQLKMELEERECKINDLEAQQNQMLKEQLVRENVHTTL